MPKDINREIASVFRSKAQALKQKTGEKYFYRARAYEQAADAIEKLDESLEDMYRRSWIKGIQKIEGIGNRLSRDIERELLRRGITRT